jgi:hypothetical protein
MTNPIPHQHDHTDDDHDEKTVDFTLPLRSSSDIRRRVVEIVDRALGRQLWVFILDAEGRQLDHIHAFEGIPASPETEVLANIVSYYADLIDSEVPGGSLVFTLERPGLATPHAFDELWADSLRAAAESLVPIRVFLAHTKGVRELAVTTAARF